jgi:hypothetical protein
MAKRVSADMYLRLPLAMKEWLERKAERNYASQNSELLRIIQARMDDESKKAAQSKKATADG